MTTIVFCDDEIIFDDKLLEGIPLFDNINKHGFKESEEKRISLDCHSSEFLLMMKYKSLFTNNNEYLEKNMISLCDYLCLDEIKQKYLDSHTNEYLFERDIISKAEYIFGLIIEKESEIYFDDEKHFENFLESPNNVKYYDNENNGKNNILFYLTYKKYDLMEDAINYGLFDKIDINKCMNFYFDVNNFNYTIFMFSCRFSNNFSSNKIIRMLLEHPNINVNLQNRVGWTALMIASRYSNTDSTENTVKMLLEHPKIDVNLQNKNGWTALMIASRTSNTDSTEKTVKMLLEHPNIDVNLQKKDSWSALMIASRYSNTDSTEKTVKILLEHPNIDVNLRNNNNYSALMIASKYSNTDSTKKTVKILSEHLDIDVKSKKTNFWSRCFGY
jgi:ankyrin repeat protein